MNYLFVIGYRVSKIKLISQIRPHMSIFFLKWCLIFIRLSLDNVQL